MANQWQVKRLAGALGAEVTNVDLRIATEAGIKQVNELLLEHKVLFFPGQTMSPEQHVAFGHNFGELEDHPNLKNPFTDHPYIFELAATHGGVADEYSFEEGEFLIGRSHGADIILPSDNVSRRHARLYTVDGRCYLEDLGSANGVFVNGRRIHEVHEIESSAQVRVGDYYLHVKSDASSASNEDRVHCKLRGRNLSVADSTARSTAFSSASPLFPQARHIPPPPACLSKPSTVPTPAWPPVSPTTTPRLTSSRSNKRARAARVSSRRSC